MDTTHYIEAVSELIARHLHVNNFNFDHQPTCKGPSINTVAAEGGIYHAFDWIKSSIVEKECITHTWEFIEAWNTTPTFANQWMTMDPYYKALQLICKALQLGHNTKLMNKHKLTDYVSIAWRLINNVIPLEPKNESSSLLKIISLNCHWTWKLLSLMVHSTELNTFGMTNTIYRDLLCRANGE